MKNFTFLLSFFMLISMVSQAQHNHEPCGSDHARTISQANNPSAVQKTADIERFTQKWIAENQHLRGSGPVITIPIVIHVVWNDPSENISDAQIQSQLDALDIDFRKQNADTTAIPSMFSGLAADPEIEFCLAKVDENGFPTTGINRVQTSYNEIGNLDTTLFLQASPLWDTTSYLNIYVCDIGAASNLAGYATFPGNPYKGLDGIVVDYEYFGKTPYVSGLGRILTHEIGHYLNLNHVWGDASGAGGCAVDDNVTDTPSQAGPNYGCPSTIPISCGSHDMYINYMDYGSDACKLMFTEGQKMRMLATLNGYRSGLLTSTACVPYVTATRFVNHAATGANNGTSWADAYTDLSDALAIGQAYDEIWVAQGTYFPGGANPDSSSTFNLPDSVRLYGGFNGTETELIQRDYLSNVTILSGDILGDDVSGDFDNNKDDNVLHVVYTDAEIDDVVIIDGFTIKGGQADEWVLFSGVLGSDLGGGLLSYGNPYIRNCTFKENHGDGGGGIWMEGSNDFLLENCSFLNNSASGGGGISVGGYTNTGFNGSIKNCYFDGNKASAGGAIKINDGEIDIKACLFENNTARNGGAIAAITYQSGVKGNITDCDFINNNATDLGGAILAIRASFEIMSCIFDENTAANAGGAIYLRDEVFKITNSLIINNTAQGDGKGGAIGADNLSSLDLTIFNSTIANNYGTVAGGIYQQTAPGSNVYIGNTILSNYNSNFASNSTTASVISLQGNVMNDTSLAHVFTHAADRNNVDPLFRDTTNNDFHLSTNSPAHDIGITANAPLFDLDGLERIGFVDAGAYEFPFFVSTEEPNVVLNEGLNLFPNPPVNQLTIEIDNDWSGDVQFQLIDVSGRILKTWEKSKYQGLHQEKISVQNLASGIYQIVIKQDAESSIARFIKL